MMLRAWTLPHWNMLFSIIELPYLNFLHAKIIRRDFRINYKWNISNSWPYLSSCEWNAATHAQFSSYFALSLRVEYPCTKQSFLHQNIPFSRTFIVLSSWKCSLWDSKTKAKTNLMDKNNCLKQIHWASLSIKGFPFPICERYSTRKHTQKE